MQIYLFLLNFKQKNFICNIKNYIFVVIFAKYSTNKKLRPNAYTSIQPELSIIKNEQLLCRKTIPGAVCIFHQSQHHRHFNQYSNNCGKRSTRIHSEKHDGNGHRQFEEITCTNKCCRSRNIVCQFPFFGPCISHKEYENGLNNQRHSNQQNIKRTFQNTIALKRENDNQCKQKAADSGCAELFQKYIFKIIQSFAFNYCFSRNY